MKKTIFLFVVSFITAQASWANTDARLLDLQHRWAKANYELSGELQVQAFETLIKVVKSEVVAHPESADFLIWEGIIQSTFAGVKGGLDALSYAKNARDALQKAIALDAGALQGSAYTSLGTLYFRVPGWPVGFGDDDKAAKLLKKSLTLNPLGIDSNFFYAEFLRDQGDNKSAEQYLLKAQKAAPRPQRPLADSGRRLQIAEALKAVREALNDDSFF